MDANEMLQILNSKSTKNSPFYEICHLIDKKDYCRAESVIKQFFDCDDKSAHSCYLKFKESYDQIFSPDINLTPQQIAHNNQVAQDWSNKVHCPYCNSTRCRKISTISKAGSVALFGIFSQKVKKQWHCDNCGSDF